MNIMPYIQLARLDRPIGSWLLLWPCWWSVMAAGGTGTAGAAQHDSLLSSLYLFALFAAGAIIMRGAGCTYNDLADHDFDARVSRTKTRPLPSGQISRRAAWGFLSLQLAGGAIVLFQFNNLAIMIGMASLAPIALYPFMKRITYWPQFFLGIAFSWGALMGWAAQADHLPLAAFALYAGCVFWVIGYDTIYALQDREDDMMLGLKSTAIALYKHVKLWLALFYTASWALITLSGALINASAGFYFGMAAAAAHLIWQIAALERNNSGKALKLFCANRDCGAIIFAAFAADRLIAIIA